MQTPQVEAKTEVTEAVSLAPSADSKRENSTNNNAESTSSVSNDYLEIENVEFLAKDVDSLGKIATIKVRNKSGQSFAMVDLKVDLIDENGDVVDSSTGKYNNLLEDGQACTVDIRAHGDQTNIYGIRVASAYVEPMLDGQTPSNHVKNVFFSPPLVAINPIDQ